MHHYENTQITWKNHTRLELGVVVGCTFHQSLWDSCHWSSVGEWVSGDRLIICKILSSAWTCSAESRRSCWKSRLGRKGYAKHFRLLAQVDPDFGTFPWRDHLVRAKSIRSPSRRRLLGRSIAWDRQNNSWVRLINQTQQTTPHLTW